VSARPKAGHVLLVTHSGVPTEWPIQRSGADDIEHLLEVFETARNMCQLELLDGGTLKLFDKDGKLLREVRGAWKSLSASGPID
jgi:hypothetical protein